MCPCVLGCMLCSFFCSQRRPPLWSLVSRSYLALQKSCNRDRTCLWARHVQRLRDAHPLCTEKSPSTALQSEGTQIQYPVLNCGDHEAS